MKKTIFLLFAIISFSHSYSQQTTDLDALLRNLGKQDQEVRLNLNRVVQQGIADSILHYAEVMATTDQTNQLQVKQILKNGVPTNLSAEAYKAIFLIVDHADVKYQKRYFTPLNKLSKQGLIKPYDIATLRDRILMHSNKKQIFGTQTIAKPIVITDNSSSPQLTSYVWTVKNPAKLEARRAEVGLSSIEEQIKAHASHGYQLIYDPSLSKRDIRSLTKSPNK